ncbi:MAG: flap structure-specific endonuclease, partial [Candidatus Aenigmarchaeota archaeon]|nr:flap structure-specific endonuclease [Candidatus Aenigmarchaeota archaeon]
EKIFDFFRNPPAEDVEIHEKQPDAERVKEILLGHGFSEERINKTLRKLHDFQDKRKQSDLQKFF